MLCTCTFDQPKHGNSAEANLSIYVSSTWTMFRFFQSHPFYIAWWYKNRDGDDIAVCVIEKRQGLTWKLSAVDDKTKKKVLIDGPYGKELRLGRYENILLFASGVGIAALISIIAEIFKTPEHTPVKLHRITLCWELDYLRKSLQHMARPLKLICTSTQGTLRGCQTLRRICSAKTLTRYQSDLSVRGQSS